MSSTSLALAETELNSDVNRVLGMLKLWFLLGGFLAFGAAREYPKCQHLAFAHRVGSSRPSTSCFSRSKYMTEALRLPDQLTSTLPPPLAKSSAPSMVINNTDTFGEDLWDDYSDLPEFPSAQGLANVSRGVSPIAVVPESGVEDNATAMSVLPSSYLDSVEKESKKHHSSAQMQQRPRRQAQPLEPEKPGPPGKILGFLTSIFAGRRDEEEDRMEDQTRNGSYLDDLNQKYSADDLHDSILEAVVPAAKAQVEKQKKKDFPGSAKDSDRKKVDRNVNASISVVNNSNSNNSRSGGNWVVDIWSSVFNRGKNNTSRVDSTKNVAVRNNRNSTNETTSSSNSTDRKGKGFDWFGLFQNNRSSSPSTPPAPSNKSSNQSSSIWSQVFRWPPFGGSSRVRPKGNVSNPQEPKSILLRPADQLTRPPKIEDLFSTPGNIEETVELLVDDVQYFASAIWRVVTNTPEPEASKLKTIPKNGHKSGEMLVLQDFKKLKEEAERREQMLEELANYPDEPVMPTPEDPKDGGNIWDSTVSLVSGTFGGKRPDSREGEGGGRPNVLKMKQQVQEKSGGSWWENLLGLNKKEAPAPPRKKFTFQRIPRKMDDNFLRTVSKKLRSDQLRIKQFQLQTDRFRNSVINATFYYDSVISLFGSEDDAKEILLPLLNTLPELSKRKALMQVYRDQREQNQNPGAPQEEGAPSNGTNPLLGWLSGTGSAIGSWAKSLVGKGEKNEDVLSGNVTLDDSQEGASSDTEGSEAVNGVPESEDLTIPPEERIRRLLSSDRNYDVLNVRIGLYTRGGITAPDLYRTMRMFGSTSILDKLVPLVVGLLEEGKGQALTDVHAGRKKTLEPPEGTQMTTNDL